jgi:hypothetical protein
MITPPPRRLFAIGGWGLACVDGMGFFYLQEGGFNFGESYGFKAMHFENKERRFFPENSKEGLLSIRTYTQIKEMD